MTKSEKKKATNGYYVDSSLEQAIVAFLYLKCFNRMFFVKIYQVMLVQLEKAACAIRLLDKYIGNTFNVVPVAEFLLEFGQKYTRVTFCQCFDV
jgi:hypothetical protein